VVSDCSEKGFTIVELLVVSLMLALLSGILYGTISGILRGRSIVLGEESTARTAQYVLERMSRELTGRVALPLDDTRGSSGGRGSTPKYLRASKSSSSSEGTDRLRFISSNAAQTSFRSIQNFGLVEVEYRLQDPVSSDADLPIDEDDEKFASEDKVLVREESPADVDEEKTRDARTLVFPLAERVRGLQFRFFKDGTWADTWEPKRASLPQAIEITLKLRGSEESIDTYRTAVAISRPTRTSNSGSPTPSPRPSPVGTPSG